MSLEPSPGGGGSGPIAELLPGWEIAGLGGQRYTRINFNLTLFGHGQVALFDTQTTLQSSGFTAPEGRYLLGMLEPLDFTTFQTGHLTLSQRGDIPTDAKYLLFYRLQELFDVRIDGTPVTMVQDPFTQSLVRGDISSFAGQNVELKISTALTPTPAGLAPQWFLDGVSFEAIPEPPPLWLFLAGAAGLARWLGKRYLLLILSLNPSLAGMSETFSASGERIPVEVRAATARLVAEFLRDGTNLNRIPLVDSRVDWNDFKNWPSEFRFRNETYQLRVMALAGEAPNNIRNSRSIKSGVGFSAWYILRGGEMQGALQPAASWAADRTLTSKSLSMGGKSLFQYRFYPNGSLYQSAGFDAEANGTRSDFFDISGRKRGSMIRSHFRDRLDVQCEWDGERVEPELFNRHSGELLYERFAKPFRTADEKFPEAVRRIVARQLEMRLGREPIQGVPLLDPAIDWNEFSNWPDEFTFRGVTYRLRLTRIDGDAISDLRSRQFAGPGVHFLATYQSPEGGLNFGPSPSACWRKDGIIYEKALSFEHKRIFLFKFYPGGGLFQFAQDDFDTRQYSAEYFDKHGRLCGKFAPTSRDPNRFVWQGRKVSPANWEKHRNKLWKDGGGGLEN